MYVSDDISLEPHDLMRKDIHLYDIVGKSYVGLLRHYVWSV
jgi:hypothetical protein